MHAAVTHTDTPRIYVACLAAYNEGTLHGAWIDADKDALDVEDEINAMLEKSPENDAEEWAIHDYDSFGPASQQLGENPDLDTVCTLAQLIAEHGKLAAEVMAIGYSAEQAKQVLEEDYQGIYDSLGDWAYEMAESTGELEQIPEHYRNYIDWDSKGRDAELGGDIFTLCAGGRSVHVFFNT